MSKVFTTEITSESIASDNPIHQRLLKAYVLAQHYAHGDLLEVGCGEGRGIDLLMPRVRSYSAIDKIETALEKLRAKYPTGKFISGNIPPLAAYADNSFDCVFTFQVIEHIDDDRQFLKEIYRVLKPGGLLLLTTPNRPLSLTRNPWHIREYTSTELTTLSQSIFGQVEMRGITGNEKVLAYYERNKKSVARITRFDILDLQHRLPAALLRIPYELMNRWNRDKLKSSSDELVMSIGHDDYLETANAAEALDLFLIARK
jgi:ubiquinone/menaquinone biosynthesis C-methylase UbiE